MAKSHPGGKPKGSKKVICKCRKVNFLRPKRKRKCSNCTRILIGSSKK